MQLIYMQPQKGCVSTNSCQKKQTYLNSEVLWKSLTAGCGMRGVNVCMSGLKKKSSSLEQTSRFNAASPVCEIAAFFWYLCCFVFFFFAQCRDFSETVESWQTLHVEAQQQQQQPTFPFIFIYLKKRNYNSGIICNINIDTIRVTLLLPQFPGATGQNAKRRRCCKVLQLL